jgi:hypothetical protein
VAPGLDFGILRTLSKREEPAPTHPDRRQNSKTLKTNKSCSNNSQNLQKKHLVLNKIKQTILKNNFSPTNIDIFERLGAFGAPKTH